jgi:aspartyl-tRNA(Asn)/glutamyl-tRNA(Gln) amidotransferase subunit B
MTDVLKTVNEKNISISDFPIIPENLGQLINLINEKVISVKIAKEVFQEMVETKKAPDEIVKEKNLVQISDTTEIESAIDKILTANASQVKEYLSGKEKVLGFFVGQIMKETKGKANPQILNKLLKKKLELLR